MPGAQYVGYWGWSLEMGSGLTRMILQGWGQTSPTSLPFGFTLDTPKPWHLTRPSPSAPGSWQPAGIPGPGFCRREEEQLAGHSQGPPVFTVSKLKGELLRLHATIE